MNLEKIAQEIEEDAEELISVAKARSGQVFVVGCSSSEVLGNKIGTGGSMKLAKVLYTTCTRSAAKHKLILAAQCCEHLNRALGGGPEGYGKIRLAAGHRTAHRTRRRRFCSQCLQ